MTEPPPPHEPGDTLSRRGPVDLGKLRRTARLRARSVLRVAKIGACMLGAAVVIPVAMITGGWLFGPKGYEGVLLAPLSVLASWAVILYVGLRRRPTPRRILRADVRALPEQVAEWLEAQWPKLPARAQASLSGLTDTLESLGHQSRGLAPDSPGAARLRKLLVDDLTPLVDGYRKLPPPVQRAPLHGGASPEQRLVEGLATLDAELRRLRDHLAADDVHSLATHQRYLELKYRDDE